MTRDQIREVDRTAIEDYGIPGVVLMENAGRSTTRVVLDLLDDASDAPVVIVCGAGNNGGDGFVIARHLHNDGVGVEILLAVDPEKLKGDARVNYEIARKMDLPMQTVTDEAKIAQAAAKLGDCRVIVDALLGTGFHGEVRPPFDAIIRAINEAEGPRVVAVDVPSGLDCDAGEPSNATVRADVTVTFVAPKTGFSKDSAREYVGDLVAVDIGAPRELTRQNGT